MQLLIVAGLALAAGICVLLSTVFGVSPISDWLLFAAEGLCVLLVVVFTQYILVGIFRDAAAM